MGLSIQKIRRFHHHVCNMPVHSVKEAEKNSYKNTAFFLSHTHLSLLIWWRAYQQTYNELTHISSTNYLHWTSVWFQTALTLFSMFQNQKKRKRVKISAECICICTVCVLVEPHESFEDLAHNLLENLWSQSINNETYLGAKATGIGCLYCLLTAI